MFCAPLAAHRSSPIHRLPVELLSYIFSLRTHDTLGDDDNDDRNPPFTTESIKTPLILSSVNHHWRNIAYNTPSLWTSICVTVELIDGLKDEPAGAAQHPTVLNNRHLISYLSLSRNYPLDILIDARDQDWDFSEPEIPSDYECDTYTPPFSSAHMRTAIGLLLPHLPRWRSINILTDSWAPMYVALQQIQPAITTVGAPLLESLTLMRCNDFVSYSPTFQPHEMKGPAFLATAEHDSAHTLNILPRLKNLTLRGVHVDWFALSSILSHAPSGLRTLELSSHSAEVRPSLTEFHHLLSTSLRLHKLVINGSGPQTPDDAHDGDRPALGDLTPISLPCLHEISIGYRSAYEGQTILELLDAPNVRNLTLEDATHPGEPEEIDAGSILTYLGTRDFPARSIHDHEPHAPALEKPSAPAPPAGPEELESPAAFPLLESVVLRGVKSCPRPLQLFFGALPAVQRLELSAMSMQAVRALLPPEPTVPTCPCPRLQSLCLRGFELAVRDFVFLVGGLAVQRLMGGSCALREVDIHVDNASGCITEDVIHVSQAGTMVKVIREVPWEEEEEEDVEDMECGAEGEVDPFKVGGAFNDPLFDAHYAGRALAR